MFELFGDFIGHGWKPDPATGEYSILAKFASGMIVFALHYWLFGQMYKDVWQWLTSPFRDE